MSRPGWVLATVAALAIGAWIAWEIILNVFARLILGIVGR